jgi:malate permease and related proteins
MAVLLNVVLPVFLMVGVTAVAYYLLHFEIRTLSRAVFYVFAPALVFDSLATSDVSGVEFGQIAAVVLLLTLVLWILGTFSARLLHLQGPTQAAFLAAILLMNAGNYGLSVNLFAFGNEGLSRATLYFTVSALVSSSLGVYLSARGRVSTRQSLLRVAGVPMVYAAGLGLACNLGNLTVPEPLSKAVHVLGQASVPVMLAVLGAQLVQTFQNRQPVLNLPALGVVTVTRLVVAPALAWLLAALVGLSGLTRDVTVLESAMPTAVITTILAAEFDSDPPFAALCVLVTTLASVLTLTVLLNLLIR